MTVLLMRTFLKRVSPVVLAWEELFGAYFSPEAAQLDFHDIEDLEMAAKSKGTRANARGKSGKGRNETHDHERAPQQLENGKWACNHKCKDKKA